MTLPYERATAGERALADMQRVLESFGCAAFGVMTDNERQVLMVQFRWRGRMVQLEASWKGYAVAWLKANPYTSRSSRSRQQHEQRALEQARVSICSVLRDWVKGQTTAIECGVLSFEAAFMPHMLLPDGRRVLDAAQQANLLPPPETAS
ncbi:MAG: hypothetical protein R3E75_08235 [Steroidobacteraceae bacterium]|nr:hypothetical protein [Nevskiaceae bacterium]MCP5472279.1 hypothetical protein [Nevskiaceae bacterium]